MRRMRRLRPPCSSCKGVLVEWGASASVKSKTHDQVRCPECGLWTHWAPKPSTVPKEKRDDEGARA